MEAIKIAVKVPFVIGDDRHGLAAWDYYDLSRPTSICSSTLRSSSRFHPFDSIRALPNRKARPSSPPPSLAIIPRVWRELGGCREKEIARAKRFICYLPIIVSPREFRFRTRRSCSIAACRNFSRILFHNR